MNIEEILDMLDELLDNSWSLPLSGGRCVVDADKVRELLEDIRLNLPSEIKQAKAIVADRMEIITVARRESEDMLRKSEDRARALVAQEEVVRQAQSKAGEILTQAQSKTRDMRSASQEFSDGLLRQTEEVLMKSLQEIKTTRQALKGAQKHLQQQAMMQQNPQTQQTQQNLQNPQNMK